MGSGHSIRQPSDVDLVIFDNLSTLCTNGSESASDAWVPMQNWLLKLRRQGVAVLLEHHAGTNGRATIRHRGSQPWTNIFDKDGYARLRITVKATL